VKHDNRGWADKFSVTPLRGLVDTYASVTIEPADLLCWISATRRDTGWTAPASAPPTTASRRTVWARATAKNSISASVNAYTARSKSCSSMPIIAPGALAPTPENCGNAAVQTV